MTSAEKLIPDLSYPSDNQVIVKNSQEEEEEEERRTGISNLVPKRKRTIPVPCPERYSPDLSNIPRRKRTVYAYTRPMPLWLLRMLRSFNIHEEPEKFFEKTLHRYDVNPRKKSFTIPFSTLIRNDFLTSNEGEALDRKKGWVRAFLVNQETSYWRISLTKLAKRDESTGASVESYVLVCAWGNIVKENGLRKDETISLWSYRRYGVLFFALCPPGPVKVRSIYPIRE